MNELKRYDVGCLYAGEDEMVPREDGLYVAYSDYAALQQKLDALTVENAALNEAIGKIGDAFETGVRDILSENIDWALNLQTPATDAYLNSVRAEGVEMFGKATIDIGEAEGEKSIIYAGRQALLFASQLRTAGQAAKDGE